MKLTNVKYCYRRDLDRWLIIFPTHAEAKAFEGFYSDGKCKPQFCTYTKTVTETTRYRAIYAQLTGRFEQLRQLYRAKDMRETIVDDLESDGTFDKIDLIFDTERGFATFRIERFETWTDWACKSILNAQYGVSAGYSDTDDAYQGGLCTRRSCCGIGIGEDPNTQRTDKERIIFTVKNFCRGEADIVKVSPWTDTFLGTNKENEKEYSWVAFKRYMQKLSATGSDIWDIEWKFDAACPMTGTEVADELHVYLKPEAYKRLFEKEEKEEPKQLLKNITDVSESMTKVLGYGTLYYYNLYFDDKSDLKNVNDKHINRSMLNSVKGTYYIRVVSYNKELPKNISSATLVWDQEENRYSVEDFTIKGYRSEGKKVWLSTGSLWSNDDYLGRVKALTPPPVPYWAKLDDDHKIGFRQKDADEVQKEIDEMTKRIYEKLEIKQVKDFYTATAWHEYLSATEDGDTVCEYCKRDVDICKEMLDATETAQTYGNLVEPIVFINHKTRTLTEFIKDSKATQEKEANNKEEKNMGPKDTTFSDFYRRLYWSAITAIKPTKILIQGTATIIWWSDGTKTIVKCQKGDKMDPEKGIAMCVMKKFMGTNETHSNYLDFAKPAIETYEKQQAAEKAKKKAEADKRRRAAAKKKGTAGNANYKRGVKGKAETENKEES